MTTKSIQKKFYIPQEVDTNIINSRYYIKHLDKHYTLIISKGKGVNGHYTGYIDELQKFVPIRINRECPNQIQVSEKQILGKNSIKYNKVTFNKCR
tara:strand:+ start:39 stop:326 length:288 start_codon:yes stop_codon:yes gene_type:complete